MTIEPMDPDSVNMTRIGMAMEMSQSDILATNKAYSCDNRVPTNGGGNFQVDTCQTMLL